MRKLFKTVLMTFLVSAGVCVSAQTSGNPEAPRESDSVIASVDGEAVTLGDILPVCRNREFELYAALKGNALQKAIYRVRLEALNTAIDNKLILGDYRRSEPFQIPPQLVESYLDDMALNIGVRSRSRFAAKVRESGMTVDQLRQQAEERLIVQAMRSRHSYTRVNITPKDVFEYFQSHPEKFGTPESWDLSVIAVKGEDGGKERKVQAIISAMEESPSPETFARLAADYSAGPNAAGGGALGRIPRKDLRQDFAEAVKEPRKGGFYGPLKLDDGDYFLFISDILPAETVNFSEAAPEIERMLSAEHRQEALQSYISSLRERAIINYCLEAPPEK